MDKLAFSLSILAFSLLIIELMKTQLDSTRLDMDLELANLLQAYVMGIQLKPSNLAKLERLQLVETQLLVNIKPE